MVSRFPASTTTGCSGTSPGMTSSSRTLHFRRERAGVNKVMIHKLSFEGRGNNMRRLLASVLLPLAAAAPLAAQFEGTVHMKMSGNSANAEGMTMRVAIKGDQQVTIMTLPATAGPMAG